MDIDDILDTVLGIAMIGAAITGLIVLGSMAVVLNILAFSSGEWIVIPLAVFVDFVMIASTLMIARLIMEAV